MDEAKLLEELEVEGEKVQYVQIRDIFTVEGESRDQIIARFDEAGYVTIARTIQTFEQSHNLNVLTETQHIALTLDELKTLVDWWEKTAGE